ncbi:hypothetical protein MCUN1_000982 [Malassezia cuniculi]|uniref:JmjC domain-containing protein n=1 Tax=Malassezia cuniculi TaxID=948313 RepID=A0AAF0EPF2_9BASI|nr:hypothetical protein MCUN1_000982 [Malassezia cuniculi]
MPYRGWAGERVERERADIGGARMWTEYVRERRPVVLEGLLVDEAWRGGSWADLGELKAKAGDALVKVERLGEGGQFGTGNARERMRLRELVEKLEGGEEGYYLTTQYESGEDEEDAEEEWPAVDDVLPAPTDRLAGDFPAQPEVLGELVLQQCNLWLGRSKEGRTTGLHHDFHDNLYMLLRGEKRFVLFPPSAHEYLHVRGAVQEVHENGLIVYEEGVRADGLTEEEAEAWRAAGAAGGADEAGEGERVAKRARVEEEEEDDDDESEEESVAPVWGEAGDDDGDDDDEWEGEHNCADDYEAVEEELAAVENKEPESFSKIKTSVLHKHFGVGGASGEIEEGELRPLAGCPAPIVVELKAGEMLYLPAGWFHEVTSRGTEGVHMAFNYWMHPPDGKEAAYVDAAAWKAYRAAVAAAVEAKQK